MQDVSPGIALSTFFAVIAGLIKVVGEVIKWRANRRIKQAYEKSAPTVAPPPVALSVAAPVHSLEVQLHAKEIELLRARYQITELEEALRRQRKALDDASHDQAQLAAALSAERAASEQLLAEMARLRKEGGYEPRDARDMARGRDGTVRSDDDRRGHLRTTRRPVPQQGRGR